MTYVSSSRDIARVVSVVAMLIMMLVRATDAPAQRPDCVARGTYVFTLAEGFGGLELRADGSAEMTLIPTHEICAQCSVLPRILRGTYRVPRIDDGRCYFTLNLVDPVPTPRDIEIEGVVAFQGSVLMFSIATIPGLGAGLALRTDTLTQPIAPGDTKAPSQ
ncbi:MAG TPA: hypothetical protein VK548_07435 [Candidatus Acidoferrum sp.]|nr:hypothetical protein [Candidatus Acidoferrum sp.]